MIYFDSRNEFHKSPFGAVKISTEVTFRIKAEGNSFAVYLVANDEKLSMKRCDHDIFEIKYKTPGEGCLVFYSFEIDFGDVKVTYGNISGLGGVGGEGCETPFQLTVYEQPLVPAWVKDAVCYQIFPDRFCREGEIIAPKPGSFLYGSWDDTPMYVRNKDSSIARWDFFGGNLAGVQKKLDYLKGLGINLIYLNPVFSARSNHRYDTADYKTVDPMLGGNEALLSLIDAAHKKGIRIILDGVFNHTGCDSIYFDIDNKYGSGAYHNADSPYRKWFTFHEDGYDSWWGIGDLPAVNELEPTYLDYIITGNNSVVKTWLEAGIDGWRLDVADELPDEFLSLLRKTCHETNPDSYIVGEVWEDATNKVSYGKLRPYFTKQELDGVMNYPFRDTMIAFINGEITAGEAAEKFLSLCENYPPDCMAASLCLLGTHDSERILTATGSKDKVLALAKMQMVYTGIPVIYYGDEVGVSGGADPDNRRTYPWGHEDREMLDEFKKIIAMRKSRPVLTDGRAWFGYFGDDVLFIKRFDENGAFYGFLNRSHREISIPWNEPLKNCETKKAIDGFVTALPLKTVYYET